MIEAVTIYSKYPLNGKLQSDLFQLYSSSESSPDSEGSGSNIFSMTLEIHVPFTEEYFRFGIPFGAGELDRIVIEYLHLLSLVLKFYFWGYDYQKKLDSFTDLSDYPQVEIKETTFFQNLRRMDLTINEITAPPHWEDYIGAFQRLSDQDYETAKRSLRLFYESIKIETQLASVYFILLISAIETLIEHTFQGRKPTICPTCKAAAYRVRQKFLSFCKRFTNNETHDFKKYLDELYQLRSKIVHSGFLLLSDDFSARIYQGIKKTSELDDYWKRIDLVLIFRTIWINWVMAPDKTMALYDESYRAQMEVDNEHD